MSQPTLEQLRSEIESGPLADVLRPHWNDVFQPQEKPEPEDPALRLAWLSATKAKSARAGKLKSDAAYEIRRLLTTPAGSSRSDALGWGRLEIKFIAAAKALR